MIYPPGLDLLIYSLNSHLFNIFIIQGIHDIGSSWFGPAHLIIKLSSMAVVLSKYLRYLFL